MRIIRGGAALSAFRIEKKLAELARLASAVGEVRAEFAYFLQLDGELSPRDEERLLNLLDGRPAAAPTAAPTCAAVPRPGVTSPWCAKATEVLHRCGLAAVRRVERGVCWRIADAEGGELPPADRERLAPALHDPMTQIIIGELREAACLFAPRRPAELRFIRLMEDGKSAIERANQELGLALSAAEIEYFYQAFQQLGRNAADVELMSFAQVNSEHCRHKIFNADWRIDGEPMPAGLFQLIKATHSGAAAGRHRILSAYEDNAAVMRGYRAVRFFPSPQDQCYRHVQEDAHILMKAETHNHPTAVSPFPGAATGAGGEIRDEAATGRGARPRAGLTGFAVSDLRIPTLPQPWERTDSRPQHLAAPLDIMLEAPIGAASYNNEFGRPALAGYFRTFEHQEQDSGRTWAYHKPIMLTGGYGVIRPQHVRKSALSPGNVIVVLGGPAMLIGLGGGAAASQTSGSGDQALDFASVQRDNPEMQRRCQEVIDQCWALGAANPILSIHDVGAGGLSNALPELVHQNGAGGAFELGAVPCADAGMSPMEIWCNEAQERYVLALAPQDLETFTALCRRENAPCAVIGAVTDDGQLRVVGERRRKVVNVPLDMLLGAPPGLRLEARRMRRPGRELQLDGISLEEAVSRVLQLPSVASKRFLVTIGDRSVSGLAAQDQMVGPWQVPVADCAVTCASFDACTGEAVALGERPPAALIDPPAGARLAVAEALTNLCAARVLRLEDVALSANWMAAAGEPGEDAALYAAVHAVSTLAQELGLVIPVGKDSMSMKTSWQDHGEQRQATAPLSLNVTAYAAVADVRLTLTPQLRRGADSVLVLIDLGLGQNRLGGSALAQVTRQLGRDSADLDDPALLRAYFNGVQLLNDAGYLLAYHDRSDGGLLAALCEMAFAGRCGLGVDVPDTADLFAFLFNEEPGGVIQVRADDLRAVLDTLERCGLPPSCAAPCAAPNEDNELVITHRGRRAYAAPVSRLHRLWSLTSCHIQALRDNPECAREEQESLQDESDPGLFSAPLHSLRSPVVKPGDSRPALGVLREQGVNGHVEMAAAFDRAGFACVDVHMNDLLDGRRSLDQLQGLAACGGFSYGDVLGAGGGWAKSILYNERLRDQFQRFFQRADSFALGVCNGCQMLSRLRDIIPGAGHWPDFVRNRSEQFESRVVMVEIMPSPSLFLRDMAGSILPIVAAHGEGRAHFPDAPQQEALPALRFVDNRGKATETYPANPNGSAGGLAGFTNDDGRFTIMMPHPERVFLQQQLPWIAQERRTGDSPWMQMFYNARKRLE